MPIDLVRLALQVEGLAAELKAGERKAGERLESAVAALWAQADALEQFRARLAASRTSWLVAGLVDGLGGRVSPPPCPGEFTVVATDGSHIDVDRHSSVRCCLINIGSAVLRYGESPGAELVAVPQLLFGDELIIADPSAPGGGERVEGALLGLVRGVAECDALAALLEGQPVERPVLGLIDGSLILWGLAGRDFEEQKRFVREELLDRRYLDALERMRVRSGRGPCVPASYISYPRSADVVNALRVGLCPHDVADCDRYCAGNRERGCDAVSGVCDADLFAVLLMPGQRSEAFVSGSRFMQRHYGEHQICFFYLKLEEEVARVEVPRWVVDGGLLDLVHCLVLDQCRRGLGYPVALQEAHEQAVVTAACREQFWGLMEGVLAEGGVALGGSAKRMSKRTRWV